MVKELEELKKLFEQEMLGCEIKYDQNFETGDTKFRFIKNGNKAFINIPIEILEKVDAESIIKILQDKDWKASIEKNENISL